MVAHHSLVPRASLYPSIYLSLCVCVSVCGKYHIYCECGAERPNTAALADGLPMGKDIEGHHDVVIFMWLGRNHLNYPAVFSGDAVARTDRSRCWQIVPSFGLLMASILILETRGNMLAILCWCNIHIYNIYSYIVARRIWFFFYFGYRINGVTCDCLWTRSMKPGPDNRPDRVRRAYSSSTPDHLTGKINARSYGRLDDVVVMLCDVECCVALGYCCRRKR